MGVTLTHAAARTVRATIAATLTGESGAAPALGSVVLQRHQRTAVARLQAAIAEYGGALLADVTGLGKTYVALAVARESRDPVVVAPAALRDMWHSAMIATGRQCRFLSIESLGRRGAVAMTAALTPDLVIVDEAHHVRNPATARYRALAILTRHARVLLLSATPIHNHDDDLRSLLGLFLGGRAAALDADTTMRCVIRRIASEAAAPLPRVDPPGRLHVPDDEHRMDAIVALPPPTPPADGGDGGVLLVYSLLRRWASSQGALVDSLRRRLARAQALLGALEAGRYPSAGELSAWAYADGVMQLAFPELAVTGTTDRGRAAALCPVIRTHASAVRALLDQLRRGDDIDECRAAHLRAIRAMHPAERVVAFSQFAETVSTLAGRLRSMPGVAALTSRGARIAGGILGRSEALARFAPAAQGRPAPAGADAIDLLLTTDLLSEGVNLQDASVVVHLDLPWTPARLEQRVGRVARLGSRHSRIAVYTMAPPASAERLVRVEERLRSKLRVSARAVGIAGTIFPALGFRDSAPNPVSPPEWVERITRRASEWLDHDGPHATMPAVAAVHAKLTGFLALVQDEGEPRLVAGLASDATDDPEVLLRAMDEASGTDAAIHDLDVERACALLARWRAMRRDRRDITLDGALHARSRRAVVDRIAAIARRTPRHLRPGIVALATTARHTVTERYGAGAEAVLQELATADMPDEAWLRAIGAFGAIHDRRMDRERERHADPWITALLLLVAIPAGET